jgi:hypothetical protein
VNVTEAVQIGGTRPLPFSRLLTDILGEHAGERLSLSELSARLRDRTWGGLLLIFAAINLLPLLPGATAITGIPLLVIAAQLAAGRSQPWFPRKLDQRGISAVHLARIAAKIAPWEERVERVLKPRLCGLTNHQGARVIGLVSFLLSVIIWLPIPFGNHVPALSITLFALALIYRDGMLVILGALTTVASLALVSVTLAAATWALVELWPRLF